MSGMRDRLLPLALVALSFSSFGQTQAFDTQLTRDGVTLNYQDARGALAAPQRKRVIRSSSPTCANARTSTRPRRRWCAL